MAQPKPPLSTSQIGIDADGAMWLATPAGMEPAGGGGGGPGPLLSSAVVAGPITATTGPFVSWASLALPAGTYDVWGRTELVMVTAPVTVTLQLLLNGTQVAGSSINIANSSGITMATVSTPPQEITLTAPEQLDFGGFTVPGSCDASAIQLFARPLA